VALEPELVFVDELPEPDEFVEPVELPELPALLEFVALPVAELVDDTVVPFVLPVPLPPPPQAASRLQDATIAAAPIQRCAMRRP
jgi:hypothetical protein